MIWAVVARGSRALSRRMAVGGGSRSKKSALMVPRCDGEGVKSCGCGCVRVCLGRATVVLGRRSGGVRAVAVASDRKARRLAGSRREERRREDEAKLSNREWSYDALRFKKALARN